MQIGRSVKFGAYFFSLIGIIMLLSAMLDLHSEFNVLHHFAFVTGTVVRMSQVETDDQQGHLSAIRFTSSDGKVEQVPISAQERFINYAPGERVKIDYPKHHPEAAHIDYDHVNIIAFSIIFTVGLIFTLIGLAITIISWISHHFSRQHS